MKELSTSEAAERLGVAVVTVRLWCKQGRFAGARSVDTPRGPVWLIPENALHGVEPRKPGPVPRPKGNGAKPTKRKRAAKRGAKK